jgi:hypothetical protein
MSTHRTRDDRGLTPAEREALTRALQALADDAPGPSSDGAPGGPSVGLGLVRSQVRRRRAVKKAALGAATLGVAAVLAVGVSQLPSWDTAPPLPGDPTDRQHDGTTTSSPEPAPTGEVETSPTTGFQPSWLEGTPVSCGMPADDLAALAGPGLTLTTRGLSAEVPGVVDTSLMNTGGKEFSGVVASAGPVAWVRDGVVVAVGPNALEAPLQLELAPEQSMNLDAQAVPTDYCSPDGDGRFTTPVPPGDYDLVPYQGVLTDSGAEYAAWAVGAGVAVSLDADGTITARD